MLTELKAGRYDFFLKANTTVYRRVKKMGRGSSYYVGLHLKRAGHEKAARFYFTLGEKLYESPFNRLCREELYETGTLEERLQSVQKRLADIQKGALQIYQREIEELTVLHNRLLLQTGAYKTDGALPKSFYTGAVTAELAGAFPQFSADMPPFLKTLTEGRIHVFKKQYTEAWTLIQAAFRLPYTLTSLAFPAVLSDIGKAGVYGAEDKTAAVSFFEQLAEKAKSERLSAENKRLILFYAFFYAGRCSSAGNLKQAVRFFEYAAEQAEAESDVDSALWYYLDTVRAISSAQHLDALMQTVAAWKNPLWYEDLVQAARTQLTAAKNWQGLEKLYTALGQTDLPEQRTAVAYTLARSGSLPQERARLLLQEISGSTHSSLYYRILAGYQLGESRFSFPARTVRTKKNETGRFTPQEAEIYIDGLLHFGLYPLVYLYSAAVYPTIPPEKAVAVSAVLEAEGLYADSIKLTALSLENTETAGTEEQLRSLYPRPWYSTVKKYASEYRIPEYLLYALIRSESFFQPEVVSHAGAVGLTQLMPATAADIARKLKITDYDLTDPETNIRFGAYYLAEMLQRSDNRIMPACFAYNAGLSRVRSWQRKTPELAEDLFLETLEYAETRGYGRKILAAAVVYGALYYGEKSNRIVRSFFPDISPLPHE